ncbi:hypothetical protein GJ496_003671 [Pomphorhynchus laevis]|nr:hypothetical protein GJ496_003671 [Pomphorhynchus laevis]
MDQKSIHERSKTNAIKQASMASNFTPISNTMAKHISSKGFQIVKFTMPYQMLQIARYIILQSMRDVTLTTVEKKTERIQQCMESAFSPSWVCVVGYRFAAIFNHEVNSFMLARYKKDQILLYKKLPSPSDENYFWRE